MKSWMEKAKNWTKAKVETVVEHTLATPEMAKDAINHTKESLKNKFNATVEKGKSSIDNAKSKINQASEKLRMMRMIRAIEQAAIEEHEAKRKLVEAMKKKMIYYHRFSQRKAYHNSYIINKK
ncbi:MAG: hypothetical protein KF872_03535 [Chitinophagales bacterium]|nr:hypothetical protein [Chitinophagales bacterium]